MIRLVPMTKTEFDTFIEISMRDQAQGQVQAGNWHAEEANEIVKKQRTRFLPDDLATPNHFFFTIEGKDSGKVGGLWYTVVEQGGKCQFLVVDIQVYDEYRRRGYGTQAFKKKKKQAREMRLTAISRYVFKQKHSARAMYQKLGYVGPDEKMSEEL